MRLTDQTKQAAHLHRPTVRTKHRTRRLPDDHARRVAVFFDGDRTTEDAVPAVLA
ncbi:hypothetical protein [Streptomyces griseomycini]|uniref:Uncharacterized protein n=1 Tax=Streptomyces griseomycini TaxID=66895 RepID=A0A7W7VAA7_9ACTN|nr:hypothetical protein [Streptomyces griseomycini]MBB4902652.1 hypothetical protein [Streptomyces griseomycini]GGQ35258.1 hypothetical protein GCM10010266_68430 [Streptomyces griseomycini]GGR63484.1 hypothetical protein GCM10015536_78310 [Streptomyces griseomycini]